MKTALTIAGSDPSGGAGFQVDLKTFHAMGVYGLSIPSVLTAQNTAGVSGIEAIRPDFISKQLEALLKDIRPDAFKTGMLYSPDAVSCVAEKTREYALANLVVDPVTVSSTGVQLMKDDGTERMRRFLFPLAKVITPNLNEASVFTGIPVTDENGMKQAAVKLREFGPGAVIITGGHLKGRAMDLLFDGEEFLSLENEMLEGEFHGTGCVFSAAVAAGLALGYGIKEAFVRAKDITFTAMKSAVRIGGGMKILNL